MSANSAPLLEAIERSNAPIFLGAWLSFVATGILGVQTVSYLKDFPNDSRWMRWSLSVLFFLCLLDATLDGHLLSLQNLRPGEVAYLTALIYGKESRIGLFLSIIIIGLCQTFLAVRSLLFSRAMSGGRLSARRAALAVLVFGLIIATAAVGFVAQQSAFRDAFSCYYRTSVDVFDDSGPRCPVPLYNILWAGLSTILDVILAIVISVDLLSAKKKNDTDGHGHADVSSTSPVLSRLISVTRRNSSVIALVQAVCLLLYIFETTGWNSVITSVLPKIYCSSIVLYISSPRRLHRQRLLAAETRAAQQAHLASSHASHHHHPPPLRRIPTGGVGGADWSEGQCSCSCCHHRTWVSSRTRNLGLGSVGKVDGGMRRSGGKIAGEREGGGGVILTRSVGFGVVEEESGHAPTRSKTLGMAEAGGKGPVGVGDVQDGLAMWLGGRGMTEPASSSPATPSPPHPAPSQAAPPFPAPPAPTATSLSPSPTTDHRPLRAQASDESMDFADMMRGLGAPPPPSPGLSFGRSSSKDRSGSSSGRTGLARLWSSS